jgi:hypothetical protein
MISASSQNPTVLGPGVYVARNIRTSHNGGMSLQMTYTRGFFRGFAKGPLGSFPVGEDIVPKSHRLSFGVGWYK